MKSLTEHLTFNVPARMAFLNITSDVEALVARAWIPVSNDSRKAARAVAASQTTGRCGSLPLFRWYRWR